MKRTRVNGLQLAEVIPYVDGEPPEWIPLFPAGELVQARDGRFWRKDAEKIAAAFAARAQDLVLDWEHASERGWGEAPAAAWITEVQVRDGGAIWGKTQWTASGAGSVQSRDYRFISPAFLVDPDTGEILELTSAALTNRPALTMPALTEREEEDVSLIKLFAELGSAHTEEAALKKVVELKSELAEAKAKAATPPLDQFVPRADFAAMTARAEKAEGEVRATAERAKSDRIEAALAAAVKDGKITPATLDYHRRQCAQEGGLAAFEQLVAALPAHVVPSGLDGKPVPQADTFDADTKALCASLGITREQYEKSQAQIKERDTQRQ